MNITEEKAQLAQLRKDFVSFYNHHNFPKEHNKDFINCMFWLALYSDPHVDQKFIDNYIISREW